MEWYYGNEMNDFLVPEDQDLLDRHHQSPENWSKWGINSPEGFNSPKNFLTMDSNTREEDFDFVDASFNKKVGFESSHYDKDQSSSSSGCGVPKQQSFQQTAFSRCQPNYQLQELSSFEQTDDIFFDTTGGLEKDISASEFVQCNSNSEDCLAIVKIENSDPSEQFSGDDAMHKQSSVEESTLEDLETIISQFNDKTRISFRDALYRLARNTKQHLVEDLDGDLTMQQTMPWDVHSESLRSEDKKPMESETNHVDRAVATLMFNGTTYRECSSY